MSKTPSQRLSCPKGMFDLYPQNDTSTNEWQDSALWSFIETEARAHAQCYRFQEVRTPILEKKSLFQRGVGEGTDIVSKEMYCLEDRKGRELCLRPEGTAPLVRSFIERSLYARPFPQRYFYLGPMFRYERQQKGRYRQHHQFGAEVFGAACPEVDAELIDMLYSFYQRLGLSKLTIEINSLGDSQARQSFRAALVDYLTPYKDSLSSDSQMRLSINPLRILDSKDPKDQEILQQAPKLEQHLSQESQIAFEKVLTILDLLNIPYRINPKLVRGLDYYCNTVFEVTCEMGAAQNSLGGGGRYDGLIQQLGGPAIPGIGFATGLERVIQALLQQKQDAIPANSSDLFLFPIEEQARTTALQIAHKLRQKGLRIEVYFSDKKLKQVLSQLNKNPPRYLSIIGEEEINRGQLTIREWHTRQETPFSLAQLDEIRTFLHEG